jgi:hypothetical protein
MTAIRGRFTRRGGGAIVHFEHPPIPDVIRFGGADWRAKREFHVTLTGTTMMNAVTDEMVKRAASGLTFAVTLQDELWQIRENETQTIIRMCDVEGAEEFFERLERGMLKAIARPPYHVTLYTIGTLRGIGIPTHVDLHRLGKQIIDPERATLMSVIQ